MNRASIFHSSYTATKALRMLVFYAGYKSQKTERMRQACLDHKRAIVNQALMKIVQVGMYWSQVKGRYPKEKLSNGAEKRIYLAIKYGNMWRSKVLIRKIRRSISKAKQPIKTRIQTNDQLNRQQLLQSLQSKIKHRQQMRENLLTEQISTRGDNLFEYSIGSIISTPNTYNAQNNYNL